MTRIEAEKRIYEHMLAIREIMREYAPDDDVLSACIRNNDYISFWNQSSFDKNFNGKNVIDFSHFDRKDEDDLQD